MMELKRNYDEILKARLNNPKSNLAVASQPITRETKKNFSQDYRTLKAQNDLAIKIATQEAKKAALEAQQRINYLRGLKAQCGLNWNK